MAARSEASVCDCSSAEIVGSNPRGHGCLCPVGVVCCHVEVSAMT